MRTLTMRCLGLVGLIVLLLTPVALAQEANDDPTHPPQADPADVGSVDAIIKAAYDVLSGPIGQARDWDRARTLFHPTARLAHRRIESKDPQLARGPFRRSSAHHISG